MTDFLAGYVTAAGAGLAGDTSLKASRLTTGGALTLYEASVGAGPPLHVHDREDECFYVLHGAMSARCGDETFEAGTGSFVFLPRGRPHRFWAVAEDARVLLIAVPGGIEDYFREMHDARNGAERTKVQERYGIHLVPG